MVNHSDSHQNREMSSLRNGKHSQSGEFGRSMTDAEGQGLLTATLPATLTRGNGRRLTSANTPDSLDRLGTTAPYSQQFDLQFGTKMSPNVKDDNFPPGYNGTLRGRRRSAEMAVKLNLHTREFPPRQTSKSKSDDKSEPQEKTGDEEKSNHKAKSGRRNRKKAKTDVNAENTEISVILENRETITPGLYAMGKPAPALRRAGRQHEKKPEVVQDAQKISVEVEVRGTTKATSVLRVTGTRDEGINQLMAEIDKKSAEFEAYRKNDVFFNRFNGDDTGTKLADEDVFGDQKKDVLPPINGNAVSFGKRKTRKYSQIVSQTNWNKLERKDTLKDGHAIKLPSINAAKTEKLSQIDTKVTPLGGQAITEKLLTNGEDYWHNMAARRPACSELPPISVAGMAVNKNRNTHIRRGRMDNINLSEPFTQDKLCHRLAKATLPSLTDKCIQRVSRVGNISSVGQHLRHISQPEPTLPPVFNVNLPPITGLPVPTTTDMKKCKGKRFA